MPKCICIRDCYLRHESERPTYYTRGDIVSFGTCPPHFSLLEEAFIPKEDEPKLPTQAKMSGVKTEDGAFDFSTASEELLMAGTYDMAELTKFGRANYGADLPDGEERATTVARFVDARYRAAVLKASMDAATVNLFVKK